MSSEFSGGVCSSLGEAMRLLCVLATVRQVVDGDVVERDRGEVVLDPVGDVRRVLAAGGRAPTETTHDAALDEVVDPVLIDVADELVQGRCGISAVEAADRHNRCAG